MWQLTCYQHASPPFFQILSSRLEDPSTFTGYANYPFHLIKYVSPHIIKGSSKLMKEVVMSLVWEGISNYEIGKKIGRSEATVRRVKKTSIALGTGVTLERKIGSKRRGKKDARADKLLVREMKKDLFITTRKLKGMHASLLENVTKRTIQHQLQKDLNIPCRRVAHKPLLAERMKEQQFYFCKSCEHWTLEDWNSGL